MKYPLVKNTFLREEQTKQALAEFVRTSNKLSMGEWCFKFEEEFAKFQGRKHAVLFNSGGSANLALLQAMRNMNIIKVGDNIGFSDLTWSTNTMPIIQMGLKPVPLDCSIDTINVMSDNILDRLRTTEMQAIFLTNVLGFCGDMDEIEKICKERNIILIVDNCESNGSETHTKNVGNYGLASTTSFYVSHQLSLIEGGMITTDDDDLVENLLLTRSNGWDRNLIPDSKKKWRDKFGITEFEARYTFYDLGFNLRPQEITGWLGCQQLPLLQDAINCRETNYKVFMKLIADNRDILEIKHEHIKKLSAFCFPIICKDKETKEKYVKKLEDAGVETRPLIAGSIQNQPFYRKYVDSVYDLPGTKFLSSCGFYFGNHAELSALDTAFFSSLFRD